jgi:mRNA interferase MazF
MNRKIMRGELYYANLSPVVGSEQGGMRPILILQNNVGNKYSPTVVVATITSRLEKTKLPTHVRLGSAHLEKDSIVLLEQIRTIDKRRLCEYIGSVTPEEMAQIEHALLVSIGMDRKAETEAG